MNTTQAVISSKDQIEQERAAMIASGRLRWFHWVIVAFSALLTIGAWYFSDSQVRANRAAQFDRESSQIVDLITERMRTYEDALLSGVAAMEVGHGKMTHAEWHTFATSLHIDTKYPGISGIGVINYVAKGELAEHISEQRAYRPDYSVHPSHSLDEYWPIVYIEPEGPNAKAIGLDMAHETNRYSAAIKARDSGSSQITGPIVLVQDSEQTPGFLFYAPYYQERSKNFIGLVYAPFIMKNLMAGTLDKDRRPVSIRVTDKDTVLYDENNLAEEEFDSEPLFARTLSLDLYGRRWEVDVQTTLGFRESTKNNQPLFILAAGIVIDLLLLTLFIMMSRASRQAIDFAERMNAQLQLRTEQLTKSNSDLESFAYAASHDLQAPVRGISVLTDYIEEDLEKYLASPDCHPDIRKHLQRLHHQADRMEHLIKGVMAYSNLGRAEETAEYTDVNEVLRTIIYDLNIPSERVIVEGELPEFETYRVRLEQVITNFVSNAFKYNHDRENAKVTIACESNNDYYTFSVADNGPGIEEKYHARIFDMFQTLQPKDEVESTGIGLSIIKKSVAALGGTVRIKSDFGAGSTFYFDWPKVI